MISMLAQISIDPVVIAVGGGLLLSVSIIALLVVRWWQRSTRRGPPPQPDLVIDIAALGNHGPPAGTPQLVCYGIPVRLAALVIAPAGRQGDLPPADLLPALIERMVPGIAAVIAVHQPVIRRWPAQLSIQGFVHAFFNNVALPGSRGKGTPWCSAAGRLQIGAKAFCVGMVFIADAPNGLGQFAIQHEGQWLDVLRIRKQAE